MARIREMKQLIGLQYDADEKLEKILSGLETYPYPAWPTASDKELAAVDERIFGLLDNMMDDIQREEFEKFSTHADLVLLEVARCRRFGREIFSAEQFWQMKIAAEARAGLFCGLANKAKISERMAELVNLATRTDSEGFEYSKLKMEYDELEVKLKTAEHGCKVYRDRNDINVKILALWDEENLYFDLPERLFAPRWYEKETAKLNELRELAMLNTREAMRSAEKANGRENTGNNSGYNSKVFKSNTEKMIRRLQEIFCLADAQYDVKKVLDSISSLKAFPYPAWPTASNRELSEIDERIFGLLDSMADDIREKECSKFSAHAGLVWDEIVRCRRFGKEIFSANQIKMREGFIEIEAGLFRELSNKAEIVKRMAEIAKLAKDADDKLNTEYRELSAELLTVQHNCEDYRDRHNKMIKLLSMQEETNLLRDLPEDFRTPQQLKNEVAKLIELKKAHREAQASVRELISFTEIEELLSRQGSAEESAKGPAKYDRKTFEKNTEVIKIRVQDMQELVGTQCDAHVLNKIVSDLCNQSYPVGDTASDKELAAIDERIFGLLDKMTDDIQREEFEKLNAHAGLVLDEIKRCRKIGKEIFPAEQFRQRTVIAETRAGVVRELTHKEKISKRMEELVQLAKGADHNGFEYKKQETEYNGLVIKLKTAESRCEVYRDLYDCYTELFARQKDLALQKQIEQLPDMVEIVNALRPPSEDPKETRLSEQKNEND